jgi:hypothetical protein
MPESFRQLTPPLAQAALRTLPKSVERVQFCDPLSDGEHEQAAALLKNRTDVALRVYAHEGFENLSFLRHYPHVLDVSIELYSLKDLSGVELLNRRLRSLTLGQTKLSHFSLAFIARFKHLQSLSIERHSKDIEVVSQLTSLRELHLRSVTLPNLKIVRPLKKLRGLTLKLGGTTHIADIAALKDLRYFEAFQVRGLSDLSAVAKLKSLTHLFLENLPQVTALPCFALLKSLRWVTLEKLQNLTDLAPLAAASKLQELALIDMRHLKVEDLRPLVGHRALRSARLGLGSQRRNQQAQELLGVGDDVTDKFEAFAKAIAGSA